jgi:hypothetical protein
LQEFAFAIGVLTVVSLGLSAGALLAEACVLVPFWRAERPDVFLGWYKQHATVLLRFFGPLEAASGLLVLGSTALAGLGLLSSWALFSASAALTIGVLASFPLYFKAANASFAAGSIPAGKVGAELKRWATWHWVRTTLAIAALLFAVIALSEQATAPAA